jgi:predicted O-methyltransferase YrrM
LLETVGKEALDLWPVNWLGHPRSYLNDGEMEVIAALARGVEPKTMIEFGCRDGRTASVLLHNIPQLERYIGIDVPMSYSPELAHQRSEMVAHPGWRAFSDPRFELILRPCGSLDLTAADLEPCDVAFIDGDHSERVVAHDSHLAREIVRKGGIIIWHDYFNGAVEVQQVLDRLHDQGWPIQHVADTWLAFCRI